MTPQPEHQAGRHIDSLLTQAGWHVCDPPAVAHRGLAIREFPLPGHGVADCLLYVNGKAAGVIEAIKAGTPLTGVETQSGTYPQGLPGWGRPLGFSSPSAGVDTRRSTGRGSAAGTGPGRATPDPEDFVARIEVTRTEVTRLDGRAAKSGMDSYPGEIPLFPTLALSNDKQPWLSDPLSCPLPGTVLLTVKDRPFL